MHGYGGGRVINALFSYPCGFSVKTILLTINERIKVNIENEVFKSYIAECLRTLTENTAKISGGSYINAKFSDIINPKPKDNRTGAEIAAEIIKKAGLEVI